MAQTSTFNEWQATQEYWALREHPVYRGEGVKSGEGRRVLVLPGLFGNDLYLYTLRDWLSRMGYRPMASTILWNAGCPRRLLAEAERPLQAALSNTEDKIAIVGHSRGGLLAKALASRYAERISQIVVLGSPLGGMLQAGPQNMQAYAEAMLQSPSPARRFVFSVGRSASRFLDPDCDSPTCDCEYMKLLFEPLPAHINLTSIYSTEDPIVPPALAHVNQGNNIQVQGTHAGLTFSAEVFPYLAELLAV